MKLSDLKPNPKNPRKITDARKQMLEDSLREFGDLSGFVFNVLSQQLVGGHQRTKVMPSGCEITIERKFNPPTKTGTVAEGYVDFDGEHHKYREVAWQPARESAANLAANKHGGEWDFALLPDMMLEIDAANIDHGLTGFDPEEWADIMAPTTAPTSTQRPSMRDKFVVPPFSVLDARQGYWQDRKRQWIALGIKSEIGRGGASIPGKTSNAMDTDFAERERERERE